MGYNDIHVLKATDVVLVWLFVWLKLYSGNIVYRVQNVEETFVGHTMAVIHQSDTTWAASHCNDCM